jgi:ABC-2 type transport system ATP-binding protein
VRAPAGRPRTPRAASDSRPEPPAITLSGVTKVFDEAPVVDALSLTVEPGSIVGVIGPSGAGKTTTIRMITGGVEPTSGTVEVLGEQPGRFSRRVRERIGYMPQLFGLYPDLTARENIDFVASLFGLLWPRRRRRVREVLSVVDLWDARGRRAGALSGGMQRRLELAAALVHEPLLLILDEPTAGIDPLLRARIWDELRRLREQGRTLVVTTQHLYEAEECDAVALIAEGRLIASAPPDELRRRATGGDVVEVETSSPVDATVLAGVEGVVSTRQIDARTLRVVVSDAGTGTPAVVDAIAAAGPDVASVREDRLSFDEVFAELVARDRASRREHGEAPTEAAGDDEPSTEKEAA